MFRFHLSTVESTGSSDDSADYDGDVECSLLSESEQIIETFLEEPLKEREEPPNANCQDDYQEEERTSEEAISSRYKSFLPDLSCSLIGREKECDFIIDSLSSSQFRFGVIHGIPGVGKTSIAVKVGHSFVSKGWSVSYHDCRNGEFSKWLLTPFKKLHKTANSAINDSFPAENSLPTLLIFDQLGNVVNDELAKTPQALKTLLDVAKDVDSFRLLIVSRKRLNFTCDNGFSLEVGSLSMTSAVKLLESYFQSRSKHHLELVAKGCGCNPLALTIISVIIEKGIPETQIIEKMSSPEQFWKILLHSAEMCQFSTKEQEGDPFEISDCGNSKTALQEKEGRYLFVKKANDLSEAKVSCNEKGLNCQWKLGLSSCEIDTLKTISNFQVSFKDQSWLSDKGTIRETLLKEKESFAVGEADGRKEDCSAENYEDLIQESGHFEPELLKVKENTCVDFG